MQYVRKLICCLLVVLAAACENGDGSSNDNVGQGGSTARYSIQGTYLYVVDDVSLRVYSIAGQTFEELGTYYIGFGIETIFSRPGYLYLGANNGMYIYSIAQPETPTFIFQYAHILACDPVVVQGDRAYITMSSISSECNRSINALEIIDITNHENPILIKNYQMESPRGLGVDGNYLFISEGPGGFKVFDITDELDIQLIKEVKNVHAYDVIARNNRLTVTGQDGIFQYQYSAANPEFLKLLSKIPVARQ